MTTEKKVLIEPLEPKIKKLILFALACRNQDSMTIKHYYIRARKVGCSTEQLLSVIDLLRKQKIHFHQGTELVFKELQMFE